MLFFVLQIGAECMATRNSVAAFNMSYFGQFYLTGPDAQAAADWIFTNNMRKPVGEWFSNAFKNETSFK